MIFRLLVLEWTCHCSLHFEVTIKTCYRSVHFTSSSRKALVQALNLLPCSHCEVLCCLSGSNLLSPQKYISCTWLFCLECRKGSVCIPHLYAITELALCCRLAENQRLRPHVVRAPPPPREAPRKAPLHQIQPLLPPPPLPPPRAQPVMWKVCSALASLPFIAPALPFSGHAGIVTDSSATCGCVQYLVLHVLVRICSIQVPDRML